MGENKKCLSLHLLTEKMLQKVCDCNFCSLFAIFLLCACACLTGVSLGMWASVGCLGGFLVSF